MKSHRKRSVILIALGAALVVMAIGGYVVYNYHQALPPMPHKQPRIAEVKMVRKAPDSTPDQVAMQSPAPVSAPDSSAPEAPPASQAAEDSNSSHPAGQSNGQGVPAHNVAERIKNGVTQLVNLPSKIL